MKSMLLTIPLLLGTLVVAHADCVSVPCTVPMMIVKDTPTAQPRPLKAECPQYVILNGQRIPFTSLERGDTSLYEEQEAQCFYFQGPIAVSIEAVIK